MLVPFLPHKTSKLSRRLGKSAPKTNKEIAEWTKKAKESNKKLAKKWSDKIWEDVRNV